LSIWIYRDTGRNDNEDRSNTFLREFMGVLIFRFFSLLYILAMEVDLNCSFLLSHTQPCIIMCFYYYYYYYPFIFFPLFFFVEKGMAVMRKKKNRTRRVVRR
jgi:hypothetical protein